MRTSLVMGTCLLFALIAVAAAFAITCDDASRTVEGLAASLQKGDLQTLESLVTPESAFLFASALQIISAPSAEKWRGRTLFGGSLSEEDAVVLRSLMAGFALATAQRVETGEPMPSDDGVRVPLTIVVKNRGVGDREGGEAAR